MLNNTHFSLEASEAVLIEPLVEWCMAGRNVTSCLLRLHSAMLDNEEIQTYHTHAKKSIANEKGGSCSPPPCTWMEISPLQIIIYVNAIYLPKYAFFCIKMTSMVASYTVIQYESHGNHNSFISHDLNPCPDGEWENVWKRRKETTKMDTASEDWAYCNPESIWTCSGDSLIVLANGQPKF